MKTTRLAAERAKPISWVTTTIVMPSRASCCMTSSTSLIISGSSAEVGSSKSMTLGSIASARAMATRCCWPPESCAGYLSAWVATPTRSSRARAFSSASFLSALRTLIWPSVTFSSTVLCAKRLKDWKTMPTSARSRASSLPSCGQRLAVDRDRAGVDRLQAVDGAAQRGLAGPGGADDDDDLAAGDGQVDVLEHVQRAEVLVDALQDDQVAGRGRVRPWPPILRSSASGSVLLGFGGQ